jgi:uncharacterized membrane protein
MRLATAGIGWLLWPILFCIATAAAVWSLRHPDRLSIIDTNKLTEPERIQGLIYLGATFGALFLVYLIASIIVRVRAGEFRVIETTSALNRRLRFLLATPFIAALRLPAIEKDSPKQTVFFAAVSAGLFVWSFYYFTPTPALGPPDAADGADEAPRPSALRRALDVTAVVPRYLAPAVVAGLWAAYGFIFTRLSITNHHALNSRTTDLGYYDNIFYQSIHGRPLGCSFIKAGWHGSAHFDPLLVLLSPLYLIYPRAELILALQSFWLGAGVVPIYLLARAKDLGRGAALLIAAAYALYPALHGANMYEFHSLSLISPLVLWLLYFLESGSPRRYVLTLVALLLVREDVSLLMCFVGLYAILTRRPQSARLGQLTIIMSLVYFVITKRWLMESSEILNSGDNEAYSFAYYYDAMIPNKTGGAGLIVTLLTNPGFTLKHILDEPKVHFLLVLFVPLLFLPFVARTGRVMLIYGLTFCLLASRPAVFVIHFQYSSLIFAVAFALVPIALRQIETGTTAPALGLDGRRLTRALAGGVFVATLLLTWKFGGLVNNQSFRGGFTRVTRSLSDEQQATYDWVNEQATKIPRGASVAATGKMGPHISNRRHAYFYPEKPRTDYVFIDEAELRGNDLERHKKAVAKGEIIELSRRGTMALFKRK